MCAAISGVEFWQQEKEGLIFKTMKQFSALICHCITFVGEGATSKF